ncbi:J domain-containing protein [Sulfurimonas sp. HSL3-7]|uniref:J domain-containing protein n=1 Tax=Sulfonitrofixus jiaomeiensis TaxID=3131938 RepID=UPI0031F8F628
MFNSIVKKAQQLAKETKEAYYEGLYGDTEEVVEAFRLLGLSNEANFEEVKRQFKELSKLYHPDKTVKSDPAQFIAIKEAYETLKEKFKAEAS